MQEESGENLDIAMNARGTNLFFGLPDDGSKSGTGTLKSPEPVRLEDDFSSHLSFQRRSSMSRIKQDKALQ